MQIETVSRVARFLVAPALLASAVSCAGFGNANAPDPMAVTYADVEPILTQYCAKCHSGEDAKEELRLTDYHSVMAGSEHGAVVVPGDPAGSSLFELVQSGKMPLGRKTPKPTAQEIAILGAWITGGAKPAS